MQWTRRTGRRIGEIRSFKAGGKEILVNPVVVAAVWCGNREETGKIVVSQKTRKWFEGLQWRFKTFVSWNFDEKGWVSCWLRGCEVGKGFWRHAVDYAVYRAWIYLLRFWDKLLKDHNAKRLKENALTAMNGHDPKKPLQPLLGRIRSANWKRLHHINQFWKLPFFAVVLSL